MYYVLQFQFLLLSFRLFFVSHPCQAGIRKQFTNSEKEVLQTVILKREQTAQEVADSQLTMNGSNGHLSTGKLPG